MSRVRPVQVVSGVGVGVGAGVGGVKVSRKRIALDTDTPPMAPSSIQTSGIPGSGSSKRRAEREKDESHSEVQRKRYTRERPTLARMVRPTYMKSAIYAVFAQRMEKERLSRETDNTPPMEPSVSTEATESSVPPPTAVKSKRSKKVLHKIFADCIDYTDDPQWKVNLEDAAAGKLHNATFSHNVLRYKSHTSKELTLNNLGSMDAILREIVNFYQQKMQVCFTDEDRIKAEEEMMIPKVQPKTINDVSTKKRGHLIDNYAMSKGKAEGLTSQEVRALTQRIKFKILNRTISKSTVILKNMAIVSMVEQDEDSTTSKSSSGKLSVEYPAVKQVLSGDLRMEYQKSKLTTKWKRLLKGSL